MSQHVIPKNDIWHHLQSSICDCEPSITMHEGEMIFVHKAWDQRQILEHALEETDSVKSLELFTDYIVEVCKWFEYLGPKWVKAKIDNGYSRMYDHWRKMDIEIKFE